AERRAAREKVPAVGAPVIAVGDLGGDILADKGGADRDARPERLPERQQLRLETDGRRVEGVPRPSEAALHLVGNQQGAAALARLVEGGREGGGQRADAALPLDRFDDDRRRLTGDGGNERRRHVGRHEAHTREQWTEWCA